MKLLKRLLREGKRVIQPPWFNYLPLVYILLTMSTVFAVANKRTTLMREGTIFWIFKICVCVGERDRGYVII